MLLQINTEDILPKSLCQKCLSDLTFVYEFIKKCEKSEEILQFTLINHENVTKIKLEEHDVNTDSTVEIESVIVKNECDLPLESETITARDECDLIPIKTVTKQDQVHRRTKPYCSYCNILFKNFEEYQKHKKIINHPRSKIHTCSICLQRFTGRYHLMNHLKTHTNERPFSCQMCSATFTSEIYLKRHAVIHSDEKPFSCKFCPKCKLMFLILRTFQ